jgi:hypothetical protein
MLTLVLAACSGSPPAPAPAPAARPPAARSSIGPTGPPASIVDCQGGGDFATIQQAVAAAPRDGWIQVEPCTYHGSIDFHGKSLWIKGTGGSAATTLDADGDDPVVAVSGEADGTALVGFTITDGAEIQVETSALRLQDVVITGTGSTAVLNLEGADVELDGVTIDESNTAFSAVILKDRGSLAVVRSTITCGGTPFGLDLGHGGTFLDWTTVSCAGVGETALRGENDVGRIHRSVLAGGIDTIQETDHYEDRYAFENTRIVGDFAQTYGTILFKNGIVESGTFTLTTISPSAEIVSSVFSGGGCAISSDAPLTVHNTDFWNTASNCNGPSFVGSDANFAADPQWVDAAGGDYTPGAGSPLLDAGPTDSWSSDVDGSRADIGITGGKFSTLGGW